MMTIYIECSNCLPLCFQHKINISVFIAIWQRVIKIEFQKTLNHSQAYGLALINDFQSLK